jgi:hypothetical protein
MFEKSAKRSIFHFPWVLTRAGRQVWTTLVFEMKCGLNSNAQTFGGTCRRRDVAHGEPMFQLTLTISAAILKQSLRSEVIYRDRDPLNQTE